MTKEEKFSRLSARQKKFVEAVLVDPDNVEWPEALTGDAQVYLFMKIAGVTESQAEFMVGSQGPCCIEVEH